MQDLLEEILILDVNETILEYSHTFMCPKFYEIRVIFVTFAGGLRYALENFTYISQVINVVRFCWGG
jgi:hypothetical protein